MENQKDKETRTLIRIAASFDEGGNARAAVDFYGETDPEKQLKLLGTLVLEIYMQTDATADEIFADAAKPFPGSAASINAALLSIGSAKIDAKHCGARSGEIGELLRCAIDGWLEKRPEYSHSDVADTGIRIARERRKNINLSNLVSGLLGEVLIDAGKTLPKPTRLWVALRLIASIFKR